MACACLEARHRDRLQQPSRHSGRLIGQHGLHHLSDIRGEHHVERVA
jgi:hypothetical protein